MSSAALPIRGNRRTEIGVVTSDKTSKTRRVEIDRLVAHPKYGKLMRRRTMKTRSVMKVIWLKLLKHGRFRRQKGGESFVWFVRRRLLSLKRLDPDPNIFWSRIEE
jgi:hypothetical protein